MITSKIFKTFASFLCFLFLTNLAFSQENLFVFGKVTNSKTGEPLIHANVYFSSTFMGASTDNNGEYAIHNITPGNYKLIVSYVGYESQTKQVRLDRSGSFNYNFQLTPKRFQYAEVVVEGKKPKGWDKNMKLFTQYFLGKSDFAKGCKIKNPFVMGFINDQNTKYFKAVADEMLTVENKTLGYVLNYTLLDFKVDRKELFYRGEPLFEDIPPKNEKELRKWKENREKAYYGSIRHFLKTLVDSTTFEEGFELNLMDAPPPNNITNIPLEDSGILFTKVNDNLYELNFDDFLGIMYLPGKKYTRRSKAIDPELFDGRGRLSSLEKNYPYSQLVIKRSPVLFNRDGVLIDPFAVKWYGSWSNHRVSNLLPWEYKPDGK